MNDALMRVLIERSLDGAVPSQAPRSPGPRTLPCPHCGAEAGKPCRNPGGTVYKGGSHRARG